MPIATCTMSADSAWRARLSSALRTAFACAMVGFVTLYGPAHLRRQVSYPAFSYVTAVLITSEAALGDAARGFWLAVYATGQVALPAALTLHLIGSDHFTGSLAAAAVGLSAFVVALPDSTPLLTKRIAFGQIVIVYVGAVVHGAEAGDYVHVVHVAASTALGTLASVLALLFPFPKLACIEVRRDCRLYAENASKRVNLIVEAISSNESSSANEFMSQELFLSKQGAKLLQGIQKNMGAMAWERPSITITKPDGKNLIERLQEVELPLKGMEIALSCCPVFPVEMIDEETKQTLQLFKARIAQKLEQTQCFSPEGKTGTSENQLWTLKNTSITTQENLSASFLLYCMQFLQTDPPVKPNTKKTQKLKIEEPDETPKGVMIELRRIIMRFLRSHNFVFAIKCSISLGLAVFLGLIYNKPNGYWSGLTIAISFTIGRQATFTVANSRAQGTAMGSVYGILCVFLFKKCPDFGFLTLIPWLVFTSFLIHSKSYGQAGAFSAAIGALLIVGRRDYGPPADFAIARITEATIGLLCFVLVELLLNPARAATLAKAELSLCFGVLQECVQQVAVFPSKNDFSASRLLQENKDRLNRHVSELEKFIAEAEIEPSFWFIPFNGVGYRKLLKSFTMLVNLLHFMIYQIDFISEAFKQVSGDLGELLKDLNSDLENFNKKVGSSQLKRLEIATSMTALKAFKKKCDVELGNKTYENAFRTVSLETDDKEVEKTLIYFLRHLEEVVKKIHTFEGTEKLKRQLALSSTAFGFCIQSLAQEAREMEKEVRELMKWDNPTMKNNDFCEVPYRI